MTMSVKTFIVTIAFLCCMFSDLFGIKALGYSDEIFGIICCIGIVIKIMSNGRKSKYNINIIKMIGIFLAIVIIGICSNYINKINTNIKVILLEAFVFIKQYMIFIFLIMSFSEKSSKSFLNVLCKISRIMIIILFILAIKNLFLDKVKSFRFLAGFGGSVADWTIMFLIIIFYCDIKNKINYLFLGSFIVICTNSGLGILGIGIIILIYMLIVKKKKLKISYFVISIPVIIALSYNEIATYLIDDTAPRALLFIYAVVTANRFFPIGAGFGTYGSASAASSYSKLYYEYGFNHRYGMAKNQTLFLMDSYYPRIIGENGYIGLVLFGIYTYIVVKEFILTMANRNKLWFALSLVIFLYVAGIGFGTGGAWGCAVYMALASFIIDGNSKSYELQ